jgi:hypothetical protein
VKDRTRRELMFLEFKRSGREGNRRGTGKIDTQIWCPKSIFRLSDYYRYASEYIRTTVFDPNLAGSRNVHREMSRSWGLRHTLMKSSECGAWGRKEWSEGVEREATIWHATRGLRSCNQVTAYLVILSTLAWENRYVCLWSEL